MVDMQHKLTTFILNSHKKEKAAGGGKKDRKRDKGEKDKVGAFCVAACRRCVVLGGFGLGWWIIDRSADADWLTDAYKWTAEGEGRRGGRGEGQEEEEEGQGQGEEGESPSSLNLCVVYACSPRLNPPGPD